MFVHELVGAAQNIQIAHALRKVISIRKEKAFWRRLWYAEPLQDLGFRQTFRVVLECRVVVERFANLAERPAFDECNRECRVIPARDLAHELQGRNAHLYLIIAGLDVLRITEHASEYLER